MVQPSYFIAGLQPSKQGLGAVVARTLTYIEHKRFDNMFIELESRYHLAQNKFISGRIRLDDQIMIENQISSAVLTAVNQLAEEIKKHPIQNYKKEIRSSDKTNPKERTRLIVNNLRVMAENGEFGLIRHRGNFSSFSLPNRPISHSAWDQLEWKNDEDRSFVKLLSEERYWLEKHVSNSRCMLIVHLEDGLNWKSVRHSLFRFKPLLEFIKTNKDRVDIISIPPGYYDQYQNLLIAGNRFLLSQIKQVSQGLRLLI